MTFETTGAGVLCRLTLEEAERAQREGYLSITPAEDGELGRAIRAEVKAQVNVPEAVRPALETWLAYKRERRQSYKPRGLAAIVTLMVGMGPERAEAAVRHSTANNYAGLFEPAGGVADLGPPEWARAIMSESELYHWKLKDRGDKQFFLENLSHERYRREAALRGGEDE